MVHENGYAVAPHAEGRVAHFEEESFGMRFVMFQCAYGNYADYT